MPTPSAPNALGLSDVNDELGNSSTAQINLSHSTVRTLAGVGSAPAVITMDELRGVSSTYDIDYVSVAGGGSGGTVEGYTNGCAGAAGAGGMLTGTFSDVAGAGTITVTIGAGASARTGGQQDGYAGSNTTITSPLISNITCIAGGFGGGGDNNDAGGTGGSGGSASSFPGPYNAGAAGTPGQGNAGGRSANWNRGAGGGGGKGAAGGDATSPNVQGAGGAGGATSIQGSPATFAGGGGGGGSSENGGGAGGSGGGGAGGNTNQNGNSGTANTGGGGGGSGNQGGDTSGAGGSGIVILKVPTANYSTQTTGSPSVAESGDYKIIKFTGSGTLTT